MPACDVVAPRNGICDVKFNDVTMIFIVPFSFSMPK